MKNKAQKTPSLTVVSVFLVSKVEACSDARLTYDHVAKNFLDEIVGFVNVNQHPSKKCVTADTAYKNANSIIFVIEVDQDRRFELFKTNGKQKKLIEYGSVFDITPPLATEINTTTMYQISGRGDKITNWEFTATQFNEAKSALCRNLKVVSELGSWSDTAETEQSASPLTSTPRNTSASTDFKGKDPEAPKKVGKTVLGDIEILESSIVAKYATIRKDGMLPVTQPLPPKEKVDYRELSRAWHAELDAVGVDKELLKKQILANFDIWGAKARLFKSMKTVESILAIRKLHPKLRDCVNLPPDHPQHIPCPLVLMLTQVPLELQEKILREARKDGPRNLRKRLQIALCSLEYRDKVVPE
ncbi:MAG: hypothetical protein WCG07_01540 [Candidatus Taylorbacteria bacterium]